MKPLLPLALGALCLTSAAGSALGESAANAAAPEALRVCADPNNLPFSNQAGAGFENKLAALVARDLGRPVHFVWWAQRRGYVRHTLNDSLCDLWPGVASGVDRLATTEPYYRSTYVFVTRKKSGLENLSFDDPRLKSLTLGVQLIGDDANNTPPAHAVARRGLIENVQGFPVYGDYGKPNPPAEIVEAVASGKIDVGIVWGPLAGYFSRHSRTPLRIEPVRPQVDDTVVPMTFAISMGVSKHNTALREQVNTVLRREQPAIAEILDEYGVPRI